MVDIMFSTASEIYQSKRRALQEGDEAVSRQIGRGKDIIAVLSERTKSPKSCSKLIVSVNENDKASEEDRLPESEVIDQVRIHGVR